MSIVATTSPKRKFRNRENLIALCQAIAGSINSNASAKECFDVIFAE
jgi:hypothetical protein